MKNTNLLTLILCLFATSMLGQQIFFPSNAPHPRADKIYKEAVYHLMNLEHRKFYIKIENLLADEPKFFMAQAHRAFHVFHIKGDKYPFEKFANFALSCKPKGDVEETYAKILEAKLENPKADVSHLLKGLIERHNHIEANFLLSNYYLEIGKVNTAYKVLFKCYRKNTYYPPLMNLLAHTSKEMGNMEMAVFYMEEYIKRHPDDADAYDSMGNFLFKSKDYQGAIKNYEKAASLSRKFKSSLTKAEKIKKHLAEAKTKKRRIR